VEISARRKCSPISTPALIGAKFYCANFMSCVTDLHI
jgi:hypothetical protein